LGLEIANIAPDSAAMNASLPAYLPAKNKSFGEKMENSSACYSYYAS
jgi:hypothetical protein